MAESVSREAGAQPAAGTRRVGLAPRTPAATQQAARARRGAAALALGRAAEDIAATFLVSHGLEILHRNFRRRLGELDLVARHGAELVIVEVRTRSSERFGGAAASIDSRKRQRIVRATQLLLQRHKELSGLRVRFDVVIVYGAHAPRMRVEWLRAAFQAF
jgi:putative endonuclease